MIYFTSDSHYNHYNIIKYCNRPFSTVEEMDQHILDKTNAYVKAEDTLYHLGDIAFARTNRWVDKCRYYLDQINCRDIRIIWGNHDNKSARNEAGKKLSDYYNCRDFDEIKINGQRITLCHYAMAIWNKSHRGAWHLYGHSHAGAEDYLNRHFPGRKSMDVGIDNIYKIAGEYRPISFDEVKEIMDSRAGCTFDHH